MRQIHARDLDLNLLPVLVAVAETGSVTGAAAQLYLTQSAVSAALARLRRTIGAPIVARHGRGVVLTERGARLVAEARPHLDAILQAALRPARFDPRTSDAIVKLGLSDVMDEWLLPELLRTLADEAPRIRLVCSPVQFRTVNEALATRRIDLAITVVDELAASVARKPLVSTGFVCLFDPRHVRLGARPSERAYLAQEHVIVSYNGDLCGVIEESFGRERRVRCAVASFSGIPAIVDGSRLVATIPGAFAAQMLALRPHLRVAPIPFTHDPGEIELLWPKALEGDSANQFVRATIERIAARVWSTSRTPERARAPSARRARRAAS